MFQNKKLQARNERIEQLEGELSLAEKVNNLILVFFFITLKILVTNFFLQQVDSFRELYLTEQEQKLDIQSELNECKVC